MHIIFIIVWAIDWVYCLLKNYVGFSSLFVSLTIMLAALAIIYSRKDGTK